MSPAKSETGKKDEERSKPEIDPEFEEMMTKTEHYVALKKEMAHCANHASLYADGLSDRSNKAWRKHLFLRVPAIVLGVSLSYLIGLQSAFPNLILSIISSIAALLVAILSALDAFFKYGQVSLDYKSAIFALHELKWKTLSERRRIALAVDGLRISQEEGVKKAEEVIDSFDRELNRILGQVMGTYIQRQKAAVTTAKPTTKTD